MTRAALLFLFCLSLPSCQGSPKTSPSERDKKLRALPTPESIHAFLEASSDKILRSFRPRARFEGSEVFVSEQNGSFEVRLSLRYQTFFRPKTRAAKISFQILPDGALGDCTFCDPVPRASVVLCPQRVKEGILRALFR